MRVPVRWPERGNRDRAGNAPDWDRRSGGVGGDGDGSHRPRAAVGDVGGLAFRCDRDGNGLESHRIGASAVAIVIGVTLPVYLEERPRLQSRAGREAEHGNRSTIRSPSPPDRLMGDDDGTPTGSGRLPRRRNSEHTRGRSCYGFRGPGHRGLGGLRGKVLNYR